MYVSRAQSIKKEVINSMAKEISTLIVGGSYFGIGYASAHPDCMILEESHILGNDFHKSLRTADMQVPPGGQRLKPLMWQG